MSTYSKLCTDIVDFGTKNSNTRTEPITKITIHHMAGVSTGKNCATAHKNGNVASANYYVGNGGDICGGVSEDRRAWTSSSPWNDQRAITIECSNSFVGDPWPVSDAAYNSTIKLCADICTRYGITPRYTGNKDGSLTLHCFYAATACVPEYTEVLTRCGWVPMSDIRIGDKIACADLDNMRITFEGVYDKVEPREQDVYENHGLIATKDHRLVYRGQYSSNWRIETFGNLLQKKHGVFIPVAGQADMPGLDLSDDMIRFYVATQADGHYMYEKRQDGSFAYYGLEYHLKKERKIERIKEILTKIGMQWKENIKSNGSVSIRIYNDGKNIVEDICEKYLNEKRFTWEWLNMNKQQAALFLDELLLWDGCVASKKYSSNEPENLDIVSAIAAMNNVGCRVKGKDVTFRDDPYITLGEETRRLAKICKKPENRVTCVSVNTGIILVRQNGRIMIIGNCPGPTWKDYHTSGKVERDIIAAMNKRPTPSPEPQNDEERIWDFLLAKIGNEYGVAGMMGNLQAESGLRPNNLQNTFEKSLGMTDEQYTAAVDIGAYTNFAGDKAGYGLAQWTGEGRKNGLLNMKKNKGCSIGDLQLQLDWLWQELSTSYKTTLQGLRTATTVYDASTIVLTQFERPKDQSEAVKQKRASYGQYFYDKYATGVQPTPSPSVPYIVRITADELNVREGPGTNYPIVMTVRRGEAFTIVQQQDNWGFLKSGVGWICLDYTQKV